MKWYGREQKKQFSEFECMILESSEVNESSGMLLLVGVVSQWSH